MACILNKQTKNAPQPTQFSPHPSHPPVLYCSGVVIDVVDNGPGVVAEDLPLVFEPGFRGKQPIQSGIPGTGLGLGIARDVMRSMGGDLKLENRRESEWGAGVMFFLPRMPK
ncbi:unnamed protein product [Choristocarpus tenellus]